jgi:hypothetical protein
MHMSRQQRRAIERRKAKLQASELGAKARASRRVEAMAKWRKRHALGFTAWQKVGIFIELIFVFTGGPLVAMFYKTGWWLKSDRRSKSHEI